jgi:hypothetical protein
MKITFINIICIAAFISLGWIEHSRAYTTTDVSPVSYDYEDNVREIKESPGLESHSVVMSAEPLQMYEDSMEPESPSNFLVLPQP